MKREEFKEDFDKYFKLRTEIGQHAPKFFVRTKIMNDLIKDFDGKLLDVGCGEGNHLDLLIKQFGFKFNYTGIDLSEKGIMFARKKLGNKAKLIQGSIYDLQEEYDVIVCGEVIEHIKEDKKFIKRICSLLKPNGILVLSTPLNKSLWTNVDVHAGHYRRYEKEELIEKITDSNFFIKEHIIWGFPLAKTFQKLISNSAMKLVETKKKPNKFFLLTRFAKYFFLIDNFFNSFEKGIGIIVSAQRYETKITEIKVKDYYKPDKLNILFYGKWTSIHGLDIVAKAIVLLKQFKKIQFTILGSHNSNDIRQKAELYLEKNKAKNYVFLDNVKIKKLAEFVRECDVCLAGCFSKTEKGNIVIRNATYEALASRVPVIVPKTPANLELLEDGVSAIICDTGNPKSLANAILKSGGYEDEL